MSPAYKVGCVIKKYSMRSQKSRGRAALQNDLKITNLKQAVKLRWPNLKFMAREKLNLDSAYSTHCPTFLLANSFNF